MINRLIYSASHIVFLLSTAAFLLPSFSFGQTIPPKPSKPSPVNGNDSAQFEADTLDPSLIILSEEYADFLSEMENALSEFNLFLREFGTFSLRETQETLQEVQQSLEENYSDQTANRALDGLNKTLEELRKVHKELQRDDKTNLYKVRNQLRKLQRDMEDARDQLEDLSYEAESNDNYDNKAINEIVARKMRQPHKAIRNAEWQMSQARTTYSLAKTNTDSLSLLVQTGDTVWLPNKPLPESAIAKTKYIQITTKPSRYFDAQNHISGTASVSGDDVEVTLKNDIGGVDVTAWNRSEVEAKLTINYATDSKESISLAKEIRLNVTSDDGRGVIDVEVRYPNRRNKKTGNIISSFLTVHVPFANPVKIENSFGPVTVFGLKNRLTVKSSFSDIDIQQVTGDSKIINSYGAIYLEKIRGRVSVENSFGPVEIVNMTGDAIVTDSYAPVTIKKIVGRLNVYNTGDITVGYVQGNAQIESSNSTMKIYDITGDLDASNSFGEISIENIGGDAMLENSNGSISAITIDGSLVVANKFASTAIEQVKQDVKVTSSNGSISITQVGGDVKTANRFGSVELSDIDGDIVLDNANSSVTIDRAKGDVQVTNQYGPVVISNVSGDITVDNQNSSVEVKDVGGVTSINTSYAIVSAERIAGDFTINNKYGNVEITDIDGGLVSDSKITTSNGNILVEMPRNAVFNLLVQTTGGKLNTDFPTTVTSRGKTTYGRMETGKDIPQLTILGKETSIRLIAK